MTTLCIFETEFGLEWAASSGNTRLGAEVIVPIAGLTSLTDEEIGRAVRASIPYALHAEARMLSEYVEHHNGHNGPTVIADELPFIKEKLIRFAGDKEVDRALSIIADYEANQARRKQKEEASQPRAGFIYLIESGGYHKIGKAVSVPNRLSQLNVQLPTPLTLVHTIAVSNMSWAENYLHQRYADKRLNGEWFNLSADDVAWICGLDSLERGA